MTMFGSALHIFFRYLFGGHFEKRSLFQACLPSFFPALSLALFFARPPLSERLEQAMKSEAVLAVFSGNFNSLEETFHN